eukprot:1011542-Rhodomonas_salina.3
MSVVVARIRVGLRPLAPGFWRCYHARLGPATTHARPPPPLHVQCGAQQAREGGKGLRKGREGHLACRRGAGRPWPPSSSSSSPPTTRPAAPALSPTCAWQAEVDDACGHHVHHLALVGVVAVVAARLAHLLHDDRALDAGVLRDEEAGLLAGLGHDLDAGADVLVQVLVLQHRLQHHRRAQQRHASARHDALLDSGAGGVEGVDEAVLALPDLHLRRAPHLDHRHAP